MKLIQSINWLIEQYIRNAEILEEDIKKEQSTFNTYRKAKLGVYKTVIEDLQKILEEGESE
jgi:hypothetical protein